MTFEAAAKSSTYADLMKLTPSAWSRASGSLLVIALSLAAIGGGLLGMVFLKPLIALLVLGVSVFGLVVLIRTLFDLVKFSAAPLERVLVVVRDHIVETRRLTTIEATHHMEQQRSQTDLVPQHVLFLELQNGERRSMLIDEEMATSLVKGDIGVAYFKQGVLLDFRPVASA